MAKFHQNDGSEFASHGDSLALDKAGNGSAGISMESLKPTMGRIGSIKPQTPAQHASVKKAAAASVSKRQAGAKSLGFKAPKLPGMLGG